MKKVICIYSKFVNVVDVKMVVFMKYEKYFEEEVIYLYYVFESVDNVIKFCVY